MMTLKQRLQQPDILIAPGVYDAFSALMVERAGFEAMYLSGASIAYTRLGAPDIGLVSFSEVCETLATIRERSAVPVIIDADTGYGNALNVQRTVMRLERAGAAAIQLEDQTSPKRCGHLDGKSLISSAEMVGKIKAALDIRASHQTLIIARTDAVAVDGFDAALERAEAYVDAGADVLFIEAVRDVSQMRLLTERFAARVPLLANMVEGGKTPLKNARQLQDIGYRLAIFPGGTVRAVAHALDAYFTELKSTGSNQGNLTRMFDFDGLNALLDTKAILQRARRYED
jgi:2-methylisocitrate lyase-like PEP mutase family enzyme